MSDPIFAMPCSKGQQGDLHRQPGHRITPEHRGTSRIPISPSCRRTSPRKSTSTARLTSSTTRLPGQPDRLCAAAASHPEGRRPGTWHMLGVAKFKRARFLLASTSEVYGDPGPPPGRGYWGHVNPIGPRGLRRSEAVRRSPDHGLPPPAGRRHLDRADLQHLRLTDARPRRAGDPDLHAAGLQNQPLTFSAMVRRPGRSVSSMTWSAA